MIFHTPLLFYEAKVWLLNLFQANTYKKKTIENKLNDLYGLSWV